VDDSVVLSIAPVKRCEKTGGNTRHSIYWHHRHNCHSDYRNNRKYHKAIHSYIANNGDKYFTNNTHCNYWHHWLWMALCYFPLVL
jgi:hypothetical protein